MADAQFTKRVQFMATPALDERVKEAAAKEETTPSEWWRQAGRARLRDTSDQPPADRPCMTASQVSTYRDMRAEARRQAQEAHFAEGSQAGRQQREAELVCLVERVEALARTLED